MSTRRESYRPDRTRVISLLLSDVDGTLVRPDKSLSAATIEAVRRLGENGIAFAVTSSRPPRGLMHLVEALKLTTPLSGFNSGMIVDPAGVELRRCSIGPKTARACVEMLDARGVDVWLFSGNDWLTRNPDGPYVARERQTIGYDPVIVDDFGEAFETATKIVGSSEDFKLLAGCETEIKRALGDQASVSLSQSYYLDITHLDANKGSAVLELSKILGIPVSQIATIGDMSNDVRMFEKSGFSIAMGNASDAVKDQADVSTDSNKDDGFAKAVERYVLPAGRSAGN